MCQRREGLATGGGGASPTIATTAAVSPASPGALLGCKLRIILEVVWL